MLAPDYLQKISIFRIGEVYSVDGRTICVKVDRDKNLSHLVYQGDIVKNVSVGSYVKILKGYTQLVAKVECEYIKENKIVDQNYHAKSDEIIRLLNMKLLGYFENGCYYKGVKELPLIGNICLLMDNAEFGLIHKFAKPDEPSITIGHLLNDENVSIEIGINKLFTSHIGIFGNTGSGKSYTLAKVYKSLFDSVSDNKFFKEHAHFLLFDFNGEYSDEHVITQNKTVYKLSTRTDDCAKIPLHSSDLLNPELIYILANATEKTQQPFIKRSLGLYTKVFKNENEALNYYKNMLRSQLKHALMIKDALKTKLIFDYAEQILPLPRDEHKNEIGLTSDFVLYPKGTCQHIGTGTWLDEKNIDDFFSVLKLNTSFNDYQFPEDFISRLIHFMYLQLILDIIHNRANNEHIAPAINKLKSFKRDFDKVFEVVDDRDLWNKNTIAIVDLNGVNLNMKKLIPLLLSHKVYSEHKENRVKNNLNTLNIIVDEAHNILSYESMRESETWKDFRLETFEEIIKEGRKFGVFLTIASQRPSDISATIISQLHNYLIHRLVNNRDLEMIEKAVSYLDKLSVESLPILPVGACVLSGVIADLSIIVQVDLLEKEAQPKSDNVSLLSSWYGITDA
jgi:hypothetical protein